LFPFDVSFQFLERSLYQSRGNFALDEREGERERELAKYWKIFCANNNPAFVSSYPRILLPQFRYSSYIGASRTLKPRVPPADGGFGKSGCLSIFYYSPLLFLVSLALGCLLSHLCRILSYFAQRRSLSRSRCIPSLAGLDFYESTELLRISFDGRCSPSVIYSSRCRSLPSMDSSWDQDGWKSALINIARERHETRELRRAFDVKGKSVAYANSSGRGANRKVK